MAEISYLQEQSFPVEQLLSYIGHPNVAEELDESTRSLIGERCRHVYQLDLDSMSDWLKAVERGMKLAKQVYEAKSTPWAGAASVKLPLISTATLQFGASAYAELIKSGDVVQAHLPGLSPLAQAIKAETPEQAAEIAGQMGVMMRERATRIATYMNWQLMEEIPEWEADMDLLLHMLPVVGCVHKKTFYDVVEGRPASLLCDPMALVIDQGAKSLDKARRVTERLPIKTSNDLIEMVRGGLYLDQNYQPCEDTQDGKLYEFLEMHRWYDLDGDGYEEPYVVTLNLKDWKVARIVARFEEQGLSVNEQGEVMKITPVQHYTKYEFFPDFEAGYWSLGWAHFLEPLTASANGIVNQLMDAGSISNTRPGFMSQTVKLQEGGELRFRMGEYKRVKVTAGRLADSFFTPPTPEPSQVLFSLLGFITEQSQQLASVMSVGLGDIPANTPAATVLSMIEQGQRVYSGIHKRIFRAMREEFKKLYRLNGIYTDPNQYMEMLNQPADPRMDFNPFDMDVMPTASPELSSKQQRRAQAEALRYITYDPAGMVVPGMDPTEVARFAVGQITEDVDRFFPNPSPEQEQQQAIVAEAEQLLLTEEVKQAMVKTKKLETEVQETQATVVQKTADAELKEAQTIKVLSDDE